MTAESPVHPIVERLKAIGRLWPLLPASLYLLTFLIVVVGYLVTLSLSSLSGGFPSLEPARLVLAMPEFREALLNTVLFVAIGTPMELCIGLCLALLIYRPFKLRSIIRTFFVMPLAIPGLVTATLLFIIFDSNGGFMNHVLLGKYWFCPQFIQTAIDWRGSQWFSLGISLFGKIWRDMPISMLILLAGINAIDPELFDAARTMGAGWRQRFRYVIIPLILPSISAVVLLRSIEMWKEFIFPYILAGRHHLLGTLIEALYIDMRADHQAAFVALVLVACIVSGALIYMSLIDILRRLLSDLRR